MKVGNEVCRVPLQSELRAAQRAQLREFASHVAIVVLFVLFMVEVVIGLSLLQPAHAASL